MLQFKPDSKVRKAACVLLRYIVYTFLVWPSIGIVFGSLACILLFEPYTSYYDFAFAINFGIPIGWSLGVVVGVMTSWCFMRSGLPGVLLWLSIGTGLGILMAYITVPHPLTFVSAAVIGYFLSLVLYWTRLH